MTVGRGGFRIGLRIGPGDVEADPMVDVSQDATSEKYCPADADEWTTTLDVAGITSGNPSNLWLLQEASGNPVDTIGGATLTANATPLYDQAVAGWTRKAVGMNDGSSSNFSTAAVVNLSTTSYLLLAYVKLTATPAATRELMGIGATTGPRSVTGSNAPVYGAQIISGAGVAGAANPSTDVRPVIVAVNRTDSTFKVYTDQEIITGSWVNPGAGSALVIFGNAGAGHLSPPARVLYAAGFSGAASLLSDAQVRTLLQTLGWSVAW